MKKKILFVLVFALVAVALLAISLFAEETIEVKYYEWPMSGNEFYTNSKAPKAYATPNEDGSYTLRDTAFSGSGTVSVNGDAKQKVFFGWFTEEGDIYAPGSTVTFTKSTILYQAWGVEVNNEDELISVVNGASGVIARLTRDMYVTKRISTMWGSSLMDLNGFNLDFKIDGNESLVGAQGTGFIILGTGKITCLDQNSNGGIYYAQERWGDGQQRLWVGKNVIIDTANRPLTVWGRVDTSNLPDIKIYGTVKTPALVKTGSVSHFPHVSIFESANITITGNTVFNCTADMADKGTLTIYGGTIALENGEAVFFTNSTKNSFDISVLGGTFLISDNQVEEISAYIPTGYAAQEATIGDKTYTVISKAKEEGHAHSFELTSSVAANCLSPKTDTYTCSCGEISVLKTGEPTGHDIEQTNDIPATATQLGKKIYECKNCDYSYEISYSYDPSNEIVSAVIKGNKVDIKLGEIFMLESVTVDGLNGYSIVGLKDYGEFTAQDVDEIYIPSGIMFVDFSADYASLTKMSICDGANVVIKNFSKLTALETIEIGVATVTFKTSCSNSVIKNIFSDKEGAYVTYEAKAFSNIQSIEKVTFSTNSDYVLSSECFGDCRGIKQIILPDYSRPQFKGSAFWQNNIEYIYVGRGIYSLTNDPFNRNYKLKTAVLMDVNSFPNGWTFCYSYDWANDNDPTTGPAEIYIHSTTLSLSNDAFYQSHGITVYTNAPITHNSAFSGCQSKTVDGVTYPAYTIVYGVPHKYVSGYKAPTCTEEGANGYVTDCPCGQQLEGTVEAKKFVAQKTTSANYETITYQSVAIPAKGHDILGGTVSVTYASFLEKGDGTFVCSECGATHDKEDAANPLFIFRGYSIREDGTAFCIEYGIDVKAINDYGRVNNAAVSVGLFAASAKKLGEMTANEAIENGNVPVVNAGVDLGDENLRGIALKIRGFNTDELKAEELVMSAYLKETKVADGVESTTTAYLQSTQCDNPSAYSMAQYLIDTENVA